MKFGWIAGMIRDKTLPVHIRLKYLRDKIHIIWNCPLYHNVLEFIRMMILHDEL